MTVEELAKRIDQTKLAPDATKAEIEGFLEMAKKYPFAAVCVPPSYVGLASGFLKGYAIKTSTVIGFPLGYQKKEVKLFEAKKAVEDGAKELDMVMNVSAFKSGALFLVEEEIKEMVSAFPHAIIKVIIETSCLCEAEKLLALETLIKGGAHFVKTSTGFSPKGATIEDIKLFNEAGKGRIKIKASGGINSLKQALSMIEAGANRIGTSKGVEIVEEFKNSLSKPF